MNSIVENQIKQFISDRKVKNREILSEAFGMRCEKIILNEEIECFFILQPEKILLIKRKLRVKIIVPLACPRQMYTIHYDIITFLKIILIN